MRFQLIEDRNNFNLVPLPGKNTTQNKGASIIR